MRLWGYGVISMGSTQEKIKGDTKLAVKSVTVDLFSRGPQ